MKIDKSLNLVIPLFEEFVDKDGKKDERITAYVHSTPVSSEVFDAYFLVIAKTYSAIMTEGLGFVGGPRVADKLLRKVAMDLGVWGGQSGVQMGLMAQIYRLTNVLAPSKNGGWETLPYEVAKKTLLTRDDASEVESAITFFTVASLMFRKAQVESMVGGAMKLWGAQTVWLNCSEYMNTLPASSPVASIGARVA